MWVHEDPYEERPTFPSLQENIQAQVCIIGAGIAGISTAYELVLRGQDVVLIEAREVLSGETGRTSGHLSYSLDAGYTDIAAKHGDGGALIAANSHKWAIERVGAIAKERGIECEYRTVNDYEISQYQKGEAGYDEEMEQLKKDAEKCASLQLPVTFDPNFAIRGWHGKPDQRGAAIYRDQAAFHPTKYLNGLLRWLSRNEKFRCFTHTRMLSIEESNVMGTIMGTPKVSVSTEGGQTIKCDSAIEATCIPLQKLSIVAQVEYHRTYCIAIRIPKGVVEDCLINDQADPYTYIRLTPADEKEVYLIVGGCDHKVGQANDAHDRYEHLESWTRARFPEASTIDYRWSGQVLDSTDLVSFIGRNQGKRHTYVVTGDTGHGLTQGVIASRILADEVTGESNPWSALYNPTRLPPLSTLPSTIGHDLQANAQYRKLGGTEIRDIEDLAPGEGGVLNKPIQHGDGPTAVYKDEGGTVHRYSGVCPHLGGRLCWNHGEKSFDCPIHGSRFSKEGICIMGPAKADLKPMAADKS